MHSEPRSGVRRRRAAAVVAVVLVLGAAGCGGGTTDPPDVPGDATSRALRAALEDETGWDAVAGLVTGVAVRDGVAVLDTTIAPANPSQADRICALVSAVVYDHAAVADVGALEIDASDGSTLIRRASVDEPC